MDPLRITHLAQRVIAGLGYDGLYLRFSSGDQDAFDDMRDELKTWGRAWSRWEPEYRWYDGKSGAWWIDGRLFRETYLDRFENGREAIAGVEALPDGQQWIARRKRRTRTAKLADRVPAHLFDEYHQLGLGAGTTAEQAKDAYRKLAKVHHPDAGGSHEGFIALKKAYERVIDWLVIIERTKV